ncbi:hypothetical protein CSC16_1300 [Proteus mirabilis]|nr:hypothetical protein CSC16_1300 [Proteus mirabilis]
MSQQEKRNVLRLCRQRYLRAQQKTVSETEKENEQLDLF